MTTTPGNSNAVLDRETDARFWAQTHYRVNKRLNSADPTDRAMMRVWLDIFAKVQREDRAGKLVLTYNHPAVEQHLSDAELAMQTAAAHLDAAVKERDPVRAQQHAEAAAVATTTASSATHAAAALQPATVSPVVVAAAAQEAAHAAAVPPPASVVDQLPAEHPAVSSIAAQPIAPPDFATAPAGSPPSMRQPAQQLAVAQAVSAPGVAVAVHEAAQARADQGVPAPTGTLAAQTIAQIRDIGIAVADETTGDIVGVVARQDPTSFAGVEGAPTGWSWLVFPTLRAAADWYGELTETPETFFYVAYYDKTSHTWPQPVNEVFGTGRAIDITAQPVPPVRSRSHTSGAVLAVVAALAVAGIAVFASGGREPS
jgi:hypothetical protein